MEQKALQLIEDQFKKHKKIVVICSWGKDSLAVLHLVKKVADKLNRRFDVLWNNTKFHYPDIYKVKNELEEKWNLNVITTKPADIDNEDVIIKKPTYWDIVETYTFPGIDGSDRSQKANSVCCYYLKKKPTKEAIKKYNWDLMFDGLTAFESDRRWLNLKDYGTTHYHKGYGLVKCHPIAWWRVKDVWNYIEKYNIRYPKVYDNEVDDYTKYGYEEQVCGHPVDRSIRSGCWPCTLPIRSEPGKLRQLREYYPKMWEHLMKKAGLAEKIVEIKLGGQGSLGLGSDEQGFMIDENIRDSYLKSRPCFFDNI